MTISSTRSGVGLGRLVGRRRGMGWGALVVVGVLRGAGVLSEEPPVVIRPAVVVEEARPALTTHETSGGGGGAAAESAVPAEEGAADTSVSDQAAVSVDVTRRESKRFELELETGVIYDDNIFLSGRQAVADTMWRAGGEVRLNAGDAVAREGSHVVARYRPDAYFFQDQTDENAVDHEASVTMRRNLAKLAVDASVSYQRTSGSTVELGDRVARDVVRARAGLTYGWGARTSFSSLVRWDAIAYREGAYDDSREWAHESFADYQAAAKLRLGLGGGIGRLAVDDGSATQDFQQVIVRGVYAATAKLTLTGRAGVEFRQTEVGSSSTPVFGFEAVHDWSAKTSMRVQGTRDVTASGSLEGQNYIRTALSLNLRHRLNDRWSASIDGGWELYDYEAVTVAAQGIDSRIDTSVFVRPGFSYALNDRWKAEVWSQWRSVDSSDPDQVYDSTQAGFNLRCSF